MKQMLHFLANAQQQFIHFIRISTAIVMIWIGGLKAFHYEAEGIVPFVANSPLMSFFYSKEAPEYKQYKNLEGQEISKNIAWHEENGTYVFSIGLGLVIVIIGLMNLAGIFYYKIGLIGGLLTFAMSLVTLSFLITTPEVYVPNLGGDFPTEHFGFPFLSAAGRLVIKDVIMMAAGLVTASDSARRILLNKIQS
ncbi:putative membrane protein YkgB [Flavobacterium sp. HSC-32F16]|uniref:DUF417 family protein n=1 Tax=Flavobacterium sp. HSC-32F16 TaxID=2910964 RepID=UPI0020A340B8|nr:DUF417 family protein [Flavobacterium sp. HSC-32F16]MCP2025280.1 putative membrane protein YkgB [Flavobacterium sp. HSC-32F16]